MDKKYRYIRIIHFRLEQCYLAEKYNNMLLLRPAANHGVLLVL